MPKKQKRLFQVTIGQIFLALVIAAIVITVAFELGIHMGKRRVIEAERKASMRVKESSLATKEGEIEIASAEKSAEAKQDKDSVRRVFGYPSFPKKRESESTESKPLTVDNSNENIQPDRKSRTLTSESQKAPIGGNLPTDAPDDPAAERAQIQPQEAVYTVQVGIFGSRENAENLTSQLKSYEYKSWMKATKSSSRNLYIVYVGGFATRDEAEEFGNSLQKRLSFIKSYIVRKIQE